MLDEKTIGFIKECVDAQSGLVESSFRFYLQAGPEDHRYRFHRLVEALTAQAQGFDSGGDGATFSKRKEAAAKALAAIEESSPIHDWPVVG